MLIVQEDRSWNYDPEHKQELLNALAAVTRSGGGSPRYTLLRTLCADWGMKPDLDFASGTAYVQNTGASHARNHRRAVMETATEIKTWSDKQQAVFGFAVNGKGSAVVIAVAGSGKTTTCVETTNRIRGSILMLAFNKSAAAELKGRVGSHVQARTFHSLGSGALWLALTKNRGMELTTDGNKIANIVDACTDNDKLHDRLGSAYIGMPTLLSDDENRAFKACICKLVSLAKQYGMGYLTNEEGLWTWFVDNFDIEPSVDGPSADECIPQARKILKLSNELAKRAGIIDFDDMIYLPLLWNLRVKAYDWAFIDEAQDTNPVRRALAKKALRPGGRLIAVGDPHQAIYGFTGANSDAIELIKKEFNAIELPLTVSYRCPVNVVAAAREFVSHIEPAPSAIAGEVIEHEDLVLDEVGDDHAILCRFNAPLVSTAYKFIAAGRGARILGREIGEGLIKLLDRVGGSTIEKVEERLEKWREREHDKAMAKGHENKAAAVSDQFECLKCIIENLSEDRRSVEQLKIQIASLFDDNGNGCVTLSTVHKFKGAERQHVWLIGRGDMPSRWARQAWQYEQEINLLYVAYTRAQNTLHIVP